MKSEFGLMVLFNAVLAALYLLWNWNEYSVLNPLYHVAISAHFPWYIQFSGTPNGNSLMVFSDANFGLLFFFLVIFGNLYLAYRLQRSKETKQNPSQNAPLPS